MELKIEYLPKEELKPYAGNAKLHPAEQVEQIKNIIKDFGFNDPIAIWGDNEIVEGHGRLLAAMEMPEISGRNRPGSLLSCIALLGMSMLTGSHILRLLKSPEITFKKSAGLRSSPNGG